MDTVLNELMSVGIHECSALLAGCQASVCELVISTDTWITHKVAHQHIHAHTYKRTHSHVQADTVVWHCDTLTAGIYRTPDMHSLITANFTCWVAINGFSRFSSWDLAACTFKVTVFTFTVTICHPSTRPVDLVQLDERIRWHCQVICQYRNDTCNKYDVMPTEATPSQTHTHTPTHTHTHMHTQTSLCRFVCVSVRVSGKISLVEMSKVVMGHS